MKKVEEIELLDPADLVPYIHNTKYHSPEQIDKLAGAIAEFGFDQPIVVDENMVIIKGHGRRAAALKLKLKEVPVIVRKGLTEAQVRALRLSDNKLAESPWIEEELKIEVALLKEENFDLELIGFSLEETEKLFQEEDDSEKKEKEKEKKDPEIPEVIESRVKSGEIWKLGRHYIACGDCTIESNIKELLKFVEGDRSPDMVWSDPPYGVNIVKSKDGKGSVGAGNACAVGIYAPIAGDESLSAAISSFNLLAKFMPKAVHFWWGGNYYAHELPPTPCWIIWDKRDGMNSNNFADAELAWTNQSTPCRVFAHLWNGMIKASERNEKRVHPTQKPVALPTWCFEKYGADEDLIVDPFLGSGVSLLAAEQMEGDRTVIGFELSDHYCEIICRRFEQISDEVPQLVGRLSGVSVPEDLSTLGF